MLIEDIEMQILKIKNLKDNWDGYGSGKIPLKLINKVKKFLDSLLDENLLQSLPATVVSPSSDGIQVEWNSFKAGIEIIFFLNGNYCLVTEINGKYEDFDLTYLIVEDIKKTMLTVFELN